MSEAEPEEWSPEGLCEQFWDVDRKMHDRRFAFILGAGASVQSGIPAAGALARRWLAELHRRLARGGLPLARWATAEALGIPGFSLDQAAVFYSQVFARRFRHQPDEGYADLEDIMQGKDPSFGYSVLAHVLAETRHKLVITTNFDNLVGEALSIFTGTAPLVCGHESLANFIRVVPRRPVVVKIHRDLLMAPMNHADEIAALQAAWIEPLTRVFSAYTPIVIGYGGNDGSLMGFLNSLPVGAIPGGIFWCYYGPAGPPAREIRELVARHRGALVPVEGFDELMLRLSARLRIPLLDQVIESKARTRVDNYRRRVEELQARLFPPAPPELAGEAEAARREDVGREVALDEAVSDAAASDAPPIEPPAQRRDPGHAGAPPPPVRRVISAEPPPGHRGVVGESHVARDTPGEPRRPPLPVEAPSLTRSPAPFTAPGGEPGASRSASQAVPSTSSPAPARAPEPVRSPHGPVPSTISPPLAAGAPQAPALVGSAGEALGPTARSGASAESRRSPSRSGELSEETAHESTSLPAAVGDEDDDIRFTATDSPASAPSAAGVATKLAGPEAPDSWRTTGELRSLSAAGEPLQRALQQIASEAPTVSAWSFYLQAKAEPDRDRALELLRSGVTRFPDDPPLLLALAERLVDPPTKESVLSAISAVQTALRHQPDATAWRHLVLLWAWRSDFAAASAALRDYRQRLHPEPELLGLAIFAFLAGLLARLQGRADTPALALFKRVSDQDVDVASLPHGLVVDLVDRLDIPGQSLYFNLYRRLSGQISFRHLLRSEPRLAALEPFDLTGLDAVEV